MVDPGGRRRPVLARRPLCRLVEALWHDLRGAREMPLRSELDPLALEPALAATMIVERRGAAAPRIRLAGAYPQDLMGMEVRGMPITALFAGAHRTRAGDLVRGAMDGPELISLDLAAETEAGRPALSAEMTVLPLRSDLGDCSRALVCLDGEGLIGRVPRRLTVEGVRRAALDAPGEAAGVPLGFAEPPAPPLRPHLRLVKR